MTGAILLSSCTTTTTVRRDTIEENGYHTVRQSCEVRKEFNPIGATVRTAEEIHRFHLSVIRSVRSSFRPEERTVEVRQALPITTERKRWSKPPLLNVIKAMNAHHRYHRHINRKVRERTMKKKKAKKSAHHPVG